MLRGFTLIEMLVSLAVISLAMAIVGIVFAITVKTAGQSAAYSEAHNWVRQFMTQMEEDLRYCDPAQSVLVMVGRTVPAALTEDDLAAGKFHRVLIGNPANVPADYDPEYDPGLDANGEYSNPRADLLMFFTNRPTVSVAPVPGLANDPYGAGVKFSPILVAYGHAALADAVWGGGAYTFPAPGNERHIEQTVTVNGNVLSKIPADRWHLARRATILEPWIGKVYLTSGGGFGDDWARITACQPDLANSLAGDVVRFDVSTFLNGFGPFTTIGGTWPAQHRPYDLVNDPAWNVASNAPNWPTATTLRDSILSLLYYNGAQANHHVATVLEDVPVELGSNMGVQMLPGCAWFQVEFLMPEDPRNSVVYSNPDPTGVSGVPYSSRSDMPRWTSIQPGATYVFVPDTQENRQAIAAQVGPGGAVFPGTRLADFARLDQIAGNDVSYPKTVISNRIIRLWPYAIRITVRVWDARGRLTEPIVRSIVHRFE